MKLPYEVMAPEVDKLYPPHYTLKPGETIEEHLLFIESFIEACGWTPEDYIEEYIRRTIHEGFSIPKENN